jgi:(p)ppGpp synthase/HD superfamily hydrolase
MAIERNVKKDTGKRQTMFSIHARINVNQNYEFGSKERSKVLSDFQELKDRINISMADEAYRTVLEKSPEIDKDYKLKKAVIFAISSHINRNLLYGEDQYYVHLHLAYRFAKKYIHLLPEGEIRLHVLQAIWLHDTMEDCSITYNDLLKHFNRDVAEIVYLLSNNRGRTRSERADDNYYATMRESAGAVFSKICDRLANVLNSKIEESSMLEKYKSELPKFEERLQTPSADFSEMFNELKEMLS